MKELVVFLLSLASLARSEELKVVAVKEVPFVYEKSDGGEAAGYLIDYMNDLTQRSGDTYKIEYVDSYGVKQADGSWTGLVGKLVSGEADIALAPLTVTSERLEVIDFTHPFMDVEISMMVKKPKAGQAIPFHSMIDMVSSGSQYGTIKDGPIIKFLDSSKFNLYSEMAMIMKDQFGDAAFPATADEGVAKAATENYVFLEESPFANWHAAKNCSIMVVDPEISITGYALGLQKNSALKDRLNTHSLAMKEDGALDQLYDKYWTSQSICKKSAVCVCGRSERESEDSDEIFGARNKGGKPGSVYRILSPLDSYPFAYRSNFLTKRQGFNIDVMEEMASRMNIRYRLKTHANWGIKQDDGSFSGQIGQLSDGKAEMALGPFTIPLDKDAESSKLFSERSEVVAFSTPVMEHVTISMVMKSPEDGSGIPQSLAELAESDRIPIVEKTSYVRNFIENSNDPTMQKLASKFQADTFVDGQKETADLVKKNPNYVYLEETPLATGLTSVDCDIASVDTGFNLGHYSFAVQKDEELLGQINQAIQEMKNDGTIARFQRLHWLSGCPTFLTDAQRAAAKLSLGK